MLLSLIIPTLNRVAELDRFLLHLRNQKLGDSLRFSEMEVIVVDQNPDDRLVPVLEKHGQELPIVRLRSESKGQSHAKNAGLRVSRGRYIAYPDDDCFYHHETLRTALDCFRRQPVNVCLFGQSLDPASGRGVFSSPYPAKGFSITKPKDPKILLAIQYCQFYPREIAGDLEFDEELCGGPQWGSAEETDHLVRFLKRGGRADFVPDLIVYHPFTGHFEIPKEKVVRYAHCFGSLCKKHKLYRILLQRSLRLLLASMVFLLSFRWHKCEWCLLTFIHRLRGYRMYSEKDA
jgi:glycosyltransferase involved in cell wall biosynthesis